MKRLLYCVLLVLPTLAFSQNLLSKKAKRCATYEVIENMRRLNPNMESDQEFENWLQAKKASARTTNPQVTVTLPVIFHVIYSPGQAEGTGTNISQALIQQQILQLNKDYANQSNSPYGVSANTEVQFALAQRDPNGVALAQPGIERINYTSKGFSAPPYTVGYASAANNYLTNTIKPNTIWDPTRYINIWVLSMESGILGIATFPTSSGLSGLNNNETSSTAGVSVSPETVGSIFMPSSCGASSNYTKGKTLSHEMGHFLGLRHIWGDGTCATDYCGDTPIHESLNEGVPTHPKANSCGTADEMFENYMDYSDDVILNTFTADQKTRIQTVLTNSPRRSTLAASNVGLVPVTATNRISFYDCSGAMAISETGNTGTYPRYRDYSLTLNVEDKATGNATVTINTTGSTTTGGGVDYQVLTPTVNFASGDNFKSINIRVFDDVLAEGSETIVLSYTISGTGVTGGPSAQTMTITISDDDNIAVTNNRITLLSQDFTTAAGWGALTGGGVNQFTISALGNAGGSGNCAYISNNGVANAYTATSTSLSVMQSPLINATNYSDLQLTFKYRVWGETDAFGPYDFGGLVYSPGSNQFSIADVNAAGAGPYVGTTAVVSGNPTINLPNSDFAGKQFYLGFYWENDNTVGNNPGLNVDDVVLTAAGTPVETVVSSSYGADVQTGTGMNHFRSTNNKAIVSLTRLTSNTTGITASITAAGSGQVPITTSTGSFQRTQKVFKVTPSVASTSDYRITLYFTSAELAVWGGSKLSLKILKLTDAASLSGPINSSNAIAVTPLSATEDVTTGVIAYTADFTGGFSQFVLVSPTFTLPVGLLTFDAQPSKKSIELSWKTAQERSNKGFHIERSTNGSDFTTIGWVAGVGTTDNQSFYKYSDNFVQPNTVYYYRLKQVDIDNRATLSYIRQARIANSSLTVTVSPNPVKGQMSVFVSGTTQPANISLVNAKGQTVARWNKVEVSSPYSIDATRFAKGHYTVIISLNGEEITKQVIIQ